MRKIINLVVSGIAGGALVLGVTKFTESPKQNIIVQEAVPSIKLANYLPSVESSTDFTNAAEITVNTVVHVKTVFQPKQTTYDPFAEFFFGIPHGRSGRGPQVGTGSGVIISEDGYIVTNNHVIANAQEIEVTLENKRSYIAKVIGTDPSTDLALLKIDAQNLPFSYFTNSDDVKVGEWVLAVGNPFNLNSTVTAGIVSAKTRRIDIIQADLGIESFIQTDAAVNPGNSGGALVNIKGELIGINTAIASNTGSFAGYSFAIPSNLVQKVINDLKEFGNVQRAFLGVNIREIDTKLADDLKLESLNGVYIENVLDKGSAKEAGLKKGDIVIKVGSKNVNSVSSLQEQIGLYRPGDKVALTILRKGSEEVVTVVLKNKSGNTDLVVRDTEILNKLGVEIEPLSSLDRHKLGINYGVVVKSIKSGKMKSAGVNENFIILKVNGKIVATSDDIINILSEESEAVYIEGIYPNGKKGYFAFGM
jgi:Do/DeqQ family serine protease